MGSCGIFPQGCFHAKMRRTLKRSLKVEMKAGPLNSRRRSSNQRHRVTSFLRLSHCPHSSSSEKETAAFARKGTDQPQAQAPDLGVYAAIRSRHGRMPWAEGSSEASPVHCPAEAGRQQYQTGDICLHCICLPIDAGLDCKSLQHPKL